MTHKGLRDGVTDQRGGVQEMFVPRKIVNMSNERARADEAKLYNNGSKNGR